MIRNPCTCIILSALLLLQSNVMAQVETISAQELQRLQRELDERKAKATRQAPTAAKPTSTPTKALPAAAIRPTPKQTQAAAPVESDADNATVVIDGFEWMRCALGQTWEENTCTGKAKDFAFDKEDEPQSAAKDFNAIGGAFGKIDWRVPTARELASLRVCNTGFEGEEDRLGGERAISSSCQKGASSPTLDVKHFPNTPASGFWSSTLMSNFYGAAWGVDFDNGLVNIYVHEMPRHVRLVRTSQ